MRDRLDRRRLTRHRRYAGPEPYLMKLSHSLADTLVTPLNDSFIDFDVLGGSIRNAEDRPSPIRPRYGGDAAAPRGRRSRPTGIAQPPVDAGEPHQRATSSPAPEFIQGPRSSSPTDFQR
jgi:hypothetical protein